MPTLAVRNMFKIKVDRRFSKTGCVRTIQAQSESYEKVSLRPKTGNGQDERVELVVLVVTPAGPH